MRNDVTVTPASGQIMEKIEATIKTHLRSMVAGMRQSGLISCDGHDEGLGFTGEIETGLFRRVKRPFLRINATAAEEAAMRTFMDLVKELRKSSRDQALGPWYHCNIEIKNRTIQFHYFWEKTPFKSINELARNNHGNVPRFAFRHRFDRRMIGELTDDHDVLSCLAIHLETRLEERQPVAEALWELFAVGDWQCDMDNGAWNQYFRREHDCNHQFLRSQLYSQTLNGLVRIHHSKAAQLYSEAIAIFAHFYPRVETARKELGIATVRKRNEWDGDERFLEARNSITTAQVAYIRANIIALERL